MLHFETKNFSFSFNSNQVRFSLDFTPLLVIFTLLTRTPITRIPRKVELKSLKFIPGSNSGFFSSTQMPSH